MIISKSALSLLSVPVLIACSIPAIQKPSQASEQSTSTTDSVTLNLRNFQDMQKKRMTPYNLVSMAKYGYFREQGIPGYGRFNNACRAGRLTAENIVQAAVNTHQISPQFLTDKKYLSSINLLLKGAMCK